MKMYPILITLFFAILTFSSHATTYTFNGPGNWDDASLWSPSYPGGLIGPDDEAIINGECIVEVSVQNEGSFTIEGNLTVEGSFIFVNFIDAIMTVNGALTINHIMYNQGLLVVENTLTVNHIFLNFTDLVNNGTINSLGSTLDSSGTFVNNGTYIDEAGFFEQGDSDHQGVWEGTGTHFNDDFVGNNCTLSPAGSGQIGEYSFNSNVVGEINLLLEIEGTGGAGIEHDKIMCFDEATVSDFNLELTLNNGFEPVAGDSFEILSANNGIIGDLSDPYGNLPSLSAGLSWVYENNGSAITLSVESTVAVELCPLEAKKQDDSVILAWCSYSEINHDFYRIERSADTKTWTTIGEVDGAGQSHATLQYSFIDKQPLMGDNYYRLISIDLDGQFEISDLAFIECEKSSQVRIWPQGFQPDDLISINVYELPAGNYEIQIYNHFGQKIYAKSSYLDESVGIHVNSSLSSGKYFIIFENDSLIINKSFLVH